jgi:alkanesulfonate monooxygenase SsuD/methylene tetrahydromethanopterin reductase-like flavin-dependent oxidoreductase (luciferase family)
MPLPISHIGLLTPGNYAENHPLPGLEQTLQQLPMARCWVSTAPGSASVISRRDFLGAAFPAAATQRTSRIQLGTTVIAIGYESPYRLAEVSAWHWRQVARKGLLAHLPFCLGHLK